MNIKELGETHINFYQNLKESVTGQIHKKIGDIFLEYKERFLKYGDYCSDMPKAQEKLAQLYERDLDVRKEVEECEKVRETPELPHQFSILLRSPYYDVIYFWYVVRKII